MREVGHLQTFELILKTRSPLFIGSGKRDTKKEYLFDSSKNEVAFLDEGKLFTYLAEHGLADEYEDFILGGAGQDLRAFLLKRCGISREALEDMVRVRIHAADALDGDHPLTEIHRFIRNGRGEIYVPGSSIKGALRAALLKAYILEDPRAGGAARTYQEQLEAWTTSGEKLSRCPKSPFDELFFHTMSLKLDRKLMPDRRNVLNSILRGIQISDSLTIPDKELCLTAKIDHFPGGAQNRINLCRESIRPGVEIRCTVTLDQSIFHKNFTKEDLEHAIQVASEHHQRTVLSRYQRATNYMNSRTILLGGGVGFQSKTIIGVACPDRALKLTSAIMQKAFRNHDHAFRDAEEGISPRALKQTKYAAADYPYGVCEVYLQ